MTVLTNKSARNDVTDWTFPVRRESKNDCYVEYYVRNPHTAKLVRKRIKCNQFVPGRERDKMVEQVISNLVGKLSNGWNPFDDFNDLKVGTALGDVRTDYLSFLDRSGKRPKTIVDYSNRLKHFYQWASHNNVKTIGQCTKQKVEEYLYFKLMKKKVSNTARNNDRTFLSAFFSWCVERFYIGENPCKGIPALQEEQKLRRPLTDDEKLKVVEYLQGRDKWFLLAVLMQYYTLIRPNELLHLKAADIDLQHQQIVPPPEISKNKKGLPVAIPDRLAKYMLELGVDGIDKDKWLFGYNCVPSVKQGNHDLFRYRWHKVREALGLPACVQFYSLKDSGIIDLINAEGVLMARDQARHSSIAITNRYALYGSRTAHEEVKRFKGKM